VTDLEAVADMDTQTLELDWDAQLDICEQYFTILLQYIRYLCERCITQLSLQSSNPPASWIPNVGRIDRSLNIVERALAFRHSPVFATCSADALWELTKHVSERTFAAGETIWDLGDPAYSFLLTVDGVVRCANSSDSRRVESYRTLGMLEAMSTQTRWYQATAVTPTTVLSVDDDSFLDILEDHFDMAIEYTAAMARRLLASRSSGVDNTL